MIIKIINKMRKVKKRYYFMLLLLPFLYMEFKGFVNVLGYCEKKDANISQLYSEQELIDRAIKFLLTISPSTQVTVEGRRLHIIPYKTVEEFKKINPNCCSVERTAHEGFTQDLSIRKQGKSYGYVHVAYLLNYEEDVEPSKFGLILEFDTCGEMSYFSQ